jgi:hypothetical protein
VVTDAAAISLAAIKDAPTGPALRLYRRATGLLRTVRTLPAVARSTTDPGGAKLGDGSAFRAIYLHLEGQGVPLHPYDQAWADLQQLRAGYLPYLRTTTALLLVPPEFRNHPAPRPSRDQERAR